MSKSSRSTVRYDLVLANFFSGILVEAAPQIAGCVSAGGQLWLSGILNAQQEEVIAALSRAGDAVDPGGPSRQMGHARGCAPQTRSLRQESEEDRERRPRQSSRRRRRQGWRERSGSASTSCPTEPRTRFAIGEALTKSGGPAMRGAFGEVDALGRAAASAGPGGWCSES